MSYFKLTLFSLQHLDVVSYMPFPVHEGRGRRRGESSRGQEGKRMHAMSRIYAGRGIPRGAMHRDAERGRDRRMWIEV
jgi:hypothetical protein